MSEFDFIKRDRANIPKETRIYVKKYLDILQQIQELMEELNLSQEDIAESLVGKNEPEHNNGTHGVNLSLKILLKIETLLREAIMSVPVNAIKLKEDESKCE